MRPSIRLRSPPPPMMVVLSLSTTTRLARPSCSSVTCSSLMPSSSEITWPPVSSAMSCSIALRRSPKPGALTAQLFERAADLIDDQRRQRLALDILGHDQQRPAGLRDLLEQGIRSFRHADLAVAEQHERVLQHRLHLLRVGDEVGRQEAAVELHAFDHVERGLGGLRLLDRDHAFAAHLLHGVGDQLADGRIVVGGNRRDLRLLLAGRDRPRHRPQRLDGGL